MNIYTKIDVYDTPLSLFKVLIKLDNTRLAKGNNVIWLVFSDSTSRGKSEVLFFLGREDTLTYRKELEEEE